MKVADLAAPMVLTSSKSGDVPVVIGRGAFRYRLNQDWSKADHERVPVINGNELYSGVCFGFKKNDYRMWQGQGFVLVLDEKDRVVSAPGAREPGYDGDALLPLMKEGDHFKNVHDVCVDDEGDLYACQWNSGRVPPYKLERI